MYTTSKGYDIEFFGIATLMDRLQSSRKIPPKPTYQVPVSGGFETYEHEEGKTLNTDEEKAAWADYIKARDTEIAEFNKRSLMMMLLKGIRVANLPDGDAWISEQKALGIDVPEEPNERRFHFIYTEVIGNLADLAAIQRGVEDASGVSEERLSQTADSFRHPMEREEAERPTDTNGNGSLDVHEPLRASESGNQVADTPKPVRRTKHG